MVEARLHCSCLWASLSTSLESGQVWVCNSAVRGRTLLCKHSLDRGSWSNMKNTSEGLKNVTSLLMSLIGTPRGPLTYKSNQITEDYKISSNVLGLGINGRVVECFTESGDKYALKVLKDNVKSRREIDLHWRASGCKHIVNIKDVYENNYSGQKCLLVVMEWWVLLEIFTKIVQLSRNCIIKIDISNLEM